MRIAGVVSPAALPRLSSMLCNTDGQIVVDLQFDLDEQRIRTVQGSAEGHVFMTCQRCLEPVEVAVEAAFNLAIAFSEESATTLPRNYDPLIVEEEEMELLDMVEEELILSLPLVPYHDDCSIQTSFGETETAPEDTEKTNPFSILAKLKADKSN